MRNLLPHGLGGRGHWLDMLGVDFGKVNRLPPSLLIRDSSWGCLGMTETLTSWHRLPELGPTSSLRSSYLGPTLC